MHRRPALATDLYELTMAGAYHSRRDQQIATFEMFVRRMPPHRSFLVCAGLQQVVEYLESFEFSYDDIAFLRTVPALRELPNDFFNRLRALRFTGDVWAIPEGTVVFAGEPLLRVTAPIIEAQIVETFVLASMNLQTMIASKAARVVMAAQGRPIAEFGGRRAHGTEAALYAARASFIAGCGSTSNVEAGMRFGIPLSGTIAHSFIMSFEDEIEAFRAYMAAFPHNSTLLVDTYDTLEAVRKIVSAGLRPSGVRLDSGDLKAVSKRVREILDESGLRETRIFASGDLDEYRIAELLEAGAPIDAFGVGTQMSTSYDAPALGGIYKLVEEHAPGEPAAGTLKLSPEKATYPFAKQVWRAPHGAPDGRHDTIGLASEVLEGEPLLRQVLLSGQRVGRQESIGEMQERALGQVAGLPPELRALDGSATYPVRISAALEAARRRVVEM